MLGDATPEIELAVGWAERYVEKEFTKRALYWWWLDLASKYSHKARVKMFYADCNTLQGMIQIMTRPYWFRMWTYQEYLLPKSQPHTVCDHIDDGIHSLLEIAELDPAVVTEGNMGEREVDTEPLIEQCQNIGGHRLFLAYVSFRYIFGVSPGAVEDDDILTIPHLLNSAVILRIDDTVANKGDKPYYKIVGQAIMSTSYFRTISGNLEQNPVEEFLVI
ncbi:hypothetical protein CBS147346_5543 [Aspergillus niger]|nr:hypothetical protein CBS147346_5543 [Aspergillus niger]